MSFLDNRKYPKNINMAGHFSQRRNVQTGTPFFEGHCAVDSSACTAMNYVLPLINLLLKVKMIQSLRAHCQSCFRICHYANCVFPTPLKNWPCVISCPSNLYSTIMGILIPSSLMVGSLCIFLREQTCTPRVFVLENLKPFFVAHLLMLSTFIGVGVLLHGCIGSVTYHDIVSV